MTEGNGHVIDPDGHARRALAAAVAQYGPQALADPAIMDGICRDRLGQLPGETILIGSAARADVPALLRARLPAEGADGAIASVARTLAETHALDPAAAAWVVREYARALGLDGRRRGKPQRPRGRRRGRAGPRLPGGGGGGAPESVPGQGGGQCGGQGRGDHAGAGQPDAGQPGRVTGSGP